MFVAYCEPETVAGDKFAEFGEFEVICQGVTHPDLHFKNLHKFDSTAGYSKHAHHFVPTHDN